MNTAVALQVRAALRAACLQGARAGGGGGGGGGGGEQVKK